jgi:hypothetical protein
MLKAELRSLIKNVIPKEDVFHDRVVDAAIEKVICELYLETFAIDPLSIQRYTVEHGVTVPIAVTYNNTKGLYYSTLPVAICSLPDKASGVRRVSPLSQAGFMYAPIDKRELDLLSDSYSNGTTSKVWYAVTQTSVEYLGMTAAIAALGVKLDILQTFSSYQDTDTVLVPEIRDRQGVDIVERVVKILQTVQPFEQIDDNAVEQTKAKQ